MGHALAAALSGCAPAPEVVDAGPPARLTGTPTYDSGLEPAAAVLPHVPADVLTEHLPFGGCNDVTPIAEPTGL